MEKNASLVTSNLEGLHMGKRTVKNSKSPIFKVIEYNFLLLKVWCLILTPLKKSVEI